MKLRWEVLHTPPFSFIHLHISLSLPLFHAGAHTQFTAADSFSRSLGRQRVSCASLVHRSYTFRLSLTLRSSETPAGSWSRIERSGTKVSRRRFRGETDLHGL